MIYMTLRAVIWKKGTKNKIRIVDLGLKYVNDAVCEGEKLSL